MRSTLHEARRPARCLALVALIVALIAVLPATAAASGSFVERHGERWYLVGYDNQRHKIYRSSDQASRLYKGFQLRFFARMAGARARLDALFKAARRQKLPLAEIDLTYPELTLVKSAQIRAVSKQAYPLILAVPIDPDHGGQYTFKIALSAPPRAAQLARLIKQISAILNAQTDVHQGKVKLTAFQMPRVEGHLGTCAVYVGGMFKADKATSAHYVRKLDPLLKKVTAALRADLGQAQIKGLVPLSRALKGNPRQGPALFNPHGPMVDDHAGYELVRPRFQRENLMVTALFATRKGTRSEILPRVTKLLERTLSGIAARQRLLQLDILALALRRKDPPSAVINKLEAHGGTRALDLLTRFTKDRTKTVPARMAAVNALSRLAGKQASKPVLEAMLALFRQVGTAPSRQRSIVAAIRRSATPHTARTLLAIYRGCSMSDLGDPYYLRADVLDGLEGLGAVAAAPLLRYTRQHKTRRQAKRQRELRKLLAAAVDKLPTAAPLRATINRFLEAK
jgi:hypothetical protein